MIRFRRAFTSLELLVVIAIIVMVAGILLPSLGQARRAASRGTGAGQRHAIGQALAIYGNEWNNAIPGSGWTSASGLYADLDSATLLPGISNDNCPNVCGLFGWMSPLGRTMGLELDSGASLASRLARFDTLRHAKIFTCPDNDYQAPPFGLPTVPVGPILSYTAGLNFDFAAAPRALPPAEGDNRLWAAPAIGYTPADSYRPRQDLVGDPSAKIFVADGAKFSTTNNPPDVSFAIMTRVGGPWADWGCYARYSRSWDRGLAPGNGNLNGGATDARLYGFRHGRQTPGAAGGYRLNAVFFDGHSETLDEKAACDPSLWTPSGTIIPAAEADVDVNQWYFHDQSVISQ